VPTAAPDHALTTSPDSGGATGARTSADRPALRRCVAGSTEAFARDIWSRAPLLSTYDDLRTSQAACEDAPSPAAFGDIFSLDAVDELLSRRGLRTPFIRIAKDGSVVAERRYTRGGGTGALIGDQVADDRVLSLFADGYTVVLQGLHRLWPPLIDFAGALVSDLGHPVQINAYVTPRSSQGFSAHYDVHDVFVLQVAGEKRWRVHAPVRPEPLRDEPWADHRVAVEKRAAEEPLLDAVLRPGDALYLPRGYLHAAEALGGTSCHLTVGVHPVTRQAVLDAVVGIVAGDRALRSSLPLGVDLSVAAQIEHDVRASIAAIVDRLRTVSTAEVAQRLAARTVGQTRPAPVAPLAQADALEHLDGDSIIAVRPHLQHTVRDEGNDVVLTLPDRILRLPTSAGKAVRVVLGGARLHVHELPDLSPEDALVLTRRLVREGVAVIEDASGAGR
jgi:lysine-specific demethylase/histidyl-hydroxylase NO66